MAYPQAKFSASTYDTAPVQHPAEPSEHTLSTSQRDTAIESGGTTSESKRNIFPFLELPPELRNHIHEYTFDSDGKSGLAPHVISRTSRQIRREYLSVYHDEIQTIKIPLLSKKQTDHFREWIQSSMPSFTVLPTLEFSYFNPNATNTYDTINCPRFAWSPFDMVEDLKVEPQTPLSSRLSRNSDHVTIAYHICIGSSGGLDASVKFRPTTAFKVAYNLKRKWTTHYIRSKTGYFEMERVESFFRDVAHQANGKDWGKDDLVLIADFLSSIKRPGKTSRKTLGQDASRRVKAVREWKMRNA